LFFLNFQYCHACPVEALSVRMSELRYGQLVEITGLAQLLSEDGDAIGVASTMSGQRGQLTDWDAVSAWIVVTFDGKRLSVEEGNLRILSTDDISAFDFVLGPVSDPAFLSEEMVDRLHSKGHFVCKLFLRPSDLDAMVRTAERAGSLFARLPGEFEEGYLGVDGTGKTMKLDDGAMLDTGPLQVAEDAIYSVGNLLMPQVETKLGFGMDTRSETTLMMPLTDEDSEPPEIGNAEAASFLKMMWRAHLQVIINAGPGAGLLKLMPKAGQPHVEVTLEPGMLAVFMPSVVKFSYKPSPKSLSLSCWFLEAEREFVLTDVGDAMQDSLMLTASGPPFPTKPEPVTVCAMSTRYAFGADEPAKVWAGFSKSGWDTGIEFPFARFDVNIYYEENADQTSGKSYTRHGGFSDGIELFDCRFFDISPVEAAGMDPTQRQVMEVTYVCLQAAGWSKKTLSAKSAQIGMFVGLDKNEWNGMPKEISAMGAASSANSITANRFSYSMNLKGASMTIDTACSGSLVSTHTAKIYLLYKQVDQCVACLTTGVNLSISPATYIGCCAAGMHSHTGRCFTFNETADGYMRGEATASHCMKRKVFERDTGDYSMVAGSQVNQDGRSASLTAPNGPSQERCNIATIREAGLQTCEIDTTECHGTGTSLGDPIEVGAYRKVMMDIPRAEPVTITTCKSNLGHCEGSAGISGFLKCCLMATAAETCPNVHLASYNPHLDIDGFPAIFMTEGCVLRGDSSVSGVLSFGFGGTNACAQVWGTNILTSRAASGADAYTRIVRKLKDAPPPEVTITGSDWEEWEVGGPGRFTRTGEKWAIDVDDEGVLTYYEADEDDVDLGSDYFLSGTHNGWSYDSMEPDAMLAGLFKGFVTVGASGEEQFQVVADESAAMTFHPEDPLTTRKSSPVKGPDDSSRENAWCIRGEEGEQFRVEFYVSESNVASVTWIKMKAALADA